MKSFLSLLSERREMRAFKKMPSWVWVYIGSNPGPLALMALKVATVIRMWMWSGASVAHTTPVREDLGSILTQTHDGILTEKLSSPFSVALTLPLKKKLQTANNFT